MDGAVVCVCVGGWEGGDREKSIALSLRASRSPRHWDSDVVTVLSRLFQGGLECKMEGSGPLCRRPVSPEWSRSAPAGVTLPPLIVTSMTRSMPASCQTLRRHMHLLVAYTCPSLSPIHGVHTDTERVPMSNKYSQYLIIAEERNGLARREQFLYRHLSLPYEVIAGKRVLHGRDHTRSGQTDREHTWVSRLLQTKTGCQHAKKRA